MHLKHLTVGTVIAMITQERRTAARCTGRNLGGWGDAQNVLSRFGSIGFNIRIPSEYQVRLKDGYTASNGKCSDIANGRRCRTSEV
jgi:hypothetical protein